MFGYSSLLVCLRGTEFLLKKHKMVVESTLNHLYLENDSASWQLLMTHMHGCGNTSVHCPFPALTSILICGSQGPLSLWCPSLLPVTEMA